MAKKSADSKKVMDVAKPDAAADRTSRPVIVSNRKIVQDPMMKPEQQEKEDDNKPEETKQPVTATGKTLQPLSAKDTDEAPAESDATEDKTSPEADTTSNKAEASDKQAEAVQPDDTNTEADQADTANSEAPEEEPAHDEEAVEKPPLASDSVPDTPPADTEQQTNDETAIVDAVAGQAGAKNKDEEQKTDDQKIKEIEALVENKKYYLPIGQATKRKHNRQAVVWFVVFIVLLAAAYVALDLELIQSPVPLPFRIF